MTQAPSTIHRELSILPEEGDSLHVDAVETVGWTEVGFRCHVPLLIGNISCPALIDTGSTTTFVRPDVVPEGTSLEPTSVKLRTVTGQTAAIRGRGTFVFAVGGTVVTFQAWVADVKDPCVLGLDFLRLIGGVLDLGAGLLVLPGGQVVQIISPHSHIPPGAATCCTSVLTDTF